MVRTVSQKIFREAKNYLVGGVNSPVRSFGYAGVEPLLIKKGKGAKVYDYDGNSYIDYVLSWGVLILGHAYPAVIKDLKKTIEYGLSFGTTNAHEVELAKILKDVIPFAEKIRFVNSGTEAVMGAVRLARGYTGRDKIIKFEHSYHGHADYLLARAGSGLATLKIPLSLGVPKDFIKDTLVIPYRDKILLDKVFKRYGKEIAAVLVEPVGGNYGVIPPDVEFLKYLRVVTKQHGSLLIADEIITGFRFNFGSFIFKSGITPDLICLGKIIGGGLPIGAYGGSKKIMDYLAPLGEVYQASTFSGNPIVMQAGIVTLRALANLRKDYGQLRDLTAFLSNTLKEIARAYRVNLEVNRFGSMFSLKFSKKEDFKKFYRGMLKAGVYFAPSEFEANFLSFAHTKKDIDNTISLARRQLWKI
ncbi:MAG: glutamate-1-semialdehyde 2,1-aminomutase [Candidatus Omnitrophota bacterium]|nr:glutamate-1-semialdehyde 2,1-aminomutase [Candidatus Omnitrophota bacterium]